MLHLTLQSCFAQRLLQIRHALAARSFWSAGAAPVRLQTQSVMVADGVQRFDLSYPVHHAGPHRLPLELARHWASRSGRLRVVALGVLRVAMPDAFLRQQVPALGKGTAPGNVAAFP